MPQGKTKTSWLLFIALAALLMLGGAGELLLTPKTHKDSTNWHYNINDASSEELTSLPGLGPKRAKIIIEWRRGKCVRDLDELEDIRGIGPKTIEKWRPYLSAGGCTLDALSDAD